MNTLLQDILAKLDRGDAPDSKHPDQKGEYWALCPYHPDTHAANFSVSDKGFSCFVCGQKGGLTELAAKLGVAVLHTQQKGKIPPPPLTLAEYGRVKRLPVDFLEGLGVKTFYLNGSQALRIPYWDEAGNEIAVRHRLSLTGTKDRFRWRSRSKLGLYGLWRLPEVRAAGWVVLVEGESDSQTLWFHRLPALGVPGANTWRRDWALHLDGLTVYVWQEPDQGGAAFVDKIGTDMPGMLVLKPPVGRKDISEAHVLGDDVPALVAQLKAAAIPFETIRAAAVSREAAKAEAQAGSLLVCPDVLAEFAEVCRALGLVGEDRNAKILYLAVTSRFLERPVSVVVKGPSSGGKSWLVETVLRAFPPDAYYALSSMSERALAYSEEPLKHRMLVLFEAIGMAGDFGTYLLRSLLSEGRVRYETVERNPTGLVPKLIEREGPTGVVTTTTWTDLHPENETRMWSLTVRDDTAQTRAVFEALAERANGNGPASVDLSPWVALQVWLQLAGLRDVSIPYAHELAARCEPSAVRLRRDFAAVLAMIKANAILHQRQRRTERGRIVAELADYVVVHGLVADVLNETVEAAVKPIIRETVEAVASLNLPLQPVKLAALAAHLGLDKSATSRRVAAARRKGWLVNQETRRGQPMQLVPGEAMPTEKPVLPHPDTLAQVGGGGGTYPSSARATVQHDTDPDTARKLEEARAWAAEAEDHAIPCEGFASWTEWLAETEADLLRTNIIRK